MHNLDKEQLEAIRQFGETGTLTEDALQDIGEMLEGFEDRIDSIWADLPKSDNGGTRYTSSYSFTSCGIECESEEYYCGDRETYSATIPYRLFLDDNYAEELKARREEEERQAEERRKKEAAARKAAETRRERQQYEKLKAKFEDNTQEK